MARIHVVVTDSSRAEIPVGITVKRYFSPFSYELEMSAEGKPKFIFGTCPACGANVPVKRVVVTDPDDEQIGRMFIDQPYSPFIVQEHRLYDWVCSGSGREPKPSQIS